MSIPICFDVFGDFACFTRPEHKIERVTYDVITPSAARGICNAIYSKPVEFYYEITKIEVMKPVQYFELCTNEITSKATTKQKKEPLNVNVIRTQRHTVYLKDVYYRIHALIHKRKDLAEVRITEHSIKKQFERRVKKGKCFFQPGLGLRECMCFFQPIDAKMKPVQQSADLGIMLYDVFDIRNNVPLDTSKKDGNSVVCPSFFHAKMNKGVIEIPRFNSDAVFSLVEKGD